MSLANLLRQPVTIYQFTAGTDEYGNTIPSATTSTITTVGFLEQSGSVETLNDRDTVVSSFQAWLPVGTAVHAFDRLTFGTQSFEIDGEPWQVFNPRTGVSSHVVAKLKVVI